MFKPHNSFSYICLKLLIVCNNSNITATIFARKQYSFLRKKEKKVCGQLRERLFGDRYGVAVAVDRSSWENGFPWPVTVAETILPHGPIPSWSPTAMPYL